VEGAALIKLLYILILLSMAGNRALYDSLKKDGYYTRSYDEFQKQFSDPEKAKRLYTMMNADKLYSKPPEVFMQQFFDTTGGVPKYKYNSTRSFDLKGKQSYLENTQLEKTFKEKYGDKNLWTKFAYVNSDETLKDLLTTNENAIDPYILAGTISEEGIVDELINAKKENPDIDVNSYYKGRSVDSKQAFGADDFLRRAGEFEQKGLTKLRLNMGEQDQETLDSSYIPAPHFYNEKQEVMKPVSFMTPKAGVNAVSAYLKNISNIIDESGIQTTPEEKEFLIHVGYNHGEGGLQRYLAKSKSAKDIISKIKTEKPQVYKNVQKRIAVSSELRNTKSLDPIAD